MVYLPVLALLCVGVSSVTPAPVVDAPWGRIAGIDLLAQFSNATYYAYLGIPYAVPPLGELRFTKPQPHPGLGQGHVFNATKKGASCIQALEQVRPYTSEDCLTLNVYTPQTNSSSGALRNVMVWIHGGGYNAGPGFSYYPGSLVTLGDVIVVVLQYRLGILGFFSTGDEVAPGNYGLWDQNLAIHWVKDNIRAFGGDPDSITIFGESAGGMSVGFQMLSPYSKGLFSRAILQSGAPLVFLLNKNPKEDMYTLANGTGCLNPSEAQPPVHWTKELERKVLECLRKVSVDKLLPFWAIKGEFFAKSEITWIPTVDKDFVPKDPAELVLDPDYLLSNGVATRDVMHGVNNNEGIRFLSIYALWAGKTDLHPSEDEVKVVLEEELAFLWKDTLPNYEAVKPVMSDIASFFYTEPRVNGTIGLQEFSDVFSDTFFVVPLVTTARSLASSKAAIRKTAPATNLGRSYVYLFDHYPVNYAYMESAIKVLPGMDHSYDLYYSFDPFPRLNFTCEDHAVSEMFIAFLTEFAKTGNPNAAVSAHLNGTVWPEFSSDAEYYLALAPEPRVEQDLYAKRVGLWLDLIPSVVNKTHVATDEKTTASTSSGWLYPSVTPLVVLCAAVYMSL